MKDFLVVGLVCASLIGSAMAQQASESKQPSGSASARETGSGMATGRKMNQKAENSVCASDPEADCAVESVKSPASGMNHLQPQQIVHRDLAAREASSGKATGRVATGDVDGDGRADRKASSSTSAAASSNAKASKGDKPKGNYDVKNMTK